MVKGLRAILLALLLIIAGAETVNAQYGYFYSGKDYGSEALYSPITQIIGGGFDMLYVLNSSPHVEDLALDQGFKNVFNSLLNPGEAVEIIGWKDFVRSEILVSFKHPQWIPNYSLHLMGGGMEFARLTDFYRYYGSKTPRLLAALTSTTEHLLNEAVETNNRHWHSYGSISDIYFFNTVGMIAFSFEPIQRFFSEKMILRSWLSQTSYSFSDHSVRNVGQFYSIKWQPPFMKNFSLFTHFGAGGLIGSGYDIKDRTVSLGLGFRTHRVVVYDEDSKLETVLGKPSGGIFIEKENSLLASFVYTHGIDYQENMRIEIFPEFIDLPTRNLKLGFWVNYSFRDQSYAGITVGWLPSIGF